MNLSARVVDLRPANDEFRIARGVQRAFQVVVVELEHEGTVGLGEAAPSRYYGGEDVAAVLRTVEAAAPLLGDDPFRIEDITAALARTFPDAHAAVCAVDLALHDLVGKLLGVPLYRMLGLSAERAPATSFTIGIDEPQVMAERAAEAAADFKVLKIKVGTDADDERLRAIRDATDLPIRIDANTAWTAEQAVENINRLSRFGIEFVEQPVAPGDNAALRFVRERVDLPIMADESAVRLADLPALVGCVDAINIKLMKCGGLREALRMIHFARACGMRIMLGCMLETSLGITAAAHLSPLVDYADLDGNLLLADDPFRGVTIGQGRLVLPAGPGLGVSPAG